MTKRIIPHRQTGSPGDAVVMGAPLTIEEAQERLESSDNTIEHLDWYLTMKK